MSTTIYRVENTGERFLYDNQLHGILNLDGSPLTFPASHDCSYDISTVNKDLSPRTIKILLGHACNYSCSYCVQKDIGNPSERPKNILTKELIKNIKQYLDLAMLTRIELWGGETLLYWKDIVEIMQALDGPDITWYIPTNGTPLQQKHVDFFKALQGTVTIGISHDGPAHVNLRGPEFLLSKADVLQSLQAENIQFSFNVVISSTNYDLFKIDRFFQDRIAELNIDANRCAIVYELARTYDKTMSKNSALHVISGDDIPKYSQILKQYIDIHVQEFGSDPKKSTMLKNSLVHFGNGVLPYALSLKHQHPITARTNCGVDNQGIITFDINGRVRVCQNTNEEYVCGHISDMKNVKIKHINFNRDFCKSCSVLRLCKSSCPLDIAHEVFLYNHAIEQAHYTEIHMAALRLLFGSDVVYV